LIDPKPRQSDLEVTNPHLHQVEAA